MKKLFVLLLALSLMICSGAIAEDRYTSGDYEYILLEDGSVEISKYRGNEELLTIPDELDGKAVTGIGRYAFSWCESLKGVTVPYGVTTVADGAFNDCHSLQTITLPDSVTRIGEQAFYNCKSLESIILPDSVTDIGYWAFASCKSLTRITLPDSVTSIGANPFVYCENLTDIVVSDSHPYLAVKEGVLFSKPDQRLVCYPQSLYAGTYNVPAGTMEIGDWAFAGCSSLNSVTIPDGVISIGGDAFYWCLYLTKISIPDSVSKIGEKAFTVPENLNPVPNPALTVTASPDSFAAQYCEENGLGYAYPDD